MKLRGSYFAIVSSALLGAAATLCTIGLLGVSGWLISQASLMPSVATLAVAIVAVRAFGVGRAFFRYTERLLSHNAALRLVVDARVDIWRYMEKLAPNGLAQFRRGDLLARMVGDVEAVQDKVLRVVLPIASAVVAAVVSIAVVWWLLPTAGVILGCVLALGATVVPALSVRDARHAAAMTVDARADLSASTQLVLRAVPDLLTCGADTEYLNELRAVDDRLANLDKKLATTSGMASATGVLLSGLAVLGCLAVAVPAVVAGRLPGVELAVVVLLALAAYESVQGLPTAAVAWVGVRQSEARLAEIRATPEPVSEPVEQARVRPDSARGDLVLRDVAVRWPGADREALSGVDLAVSDGRRVAIVGPSGSGKSSLASALLRFVDYDGSITLNGFELRGLPGREVRSVIQACAQDGHVFDSTIRANLALARPDATDEQLTDALVAVRLWDWVASLPQGLDTRVGERGTTLSGGQRQRLLLARIKLSDPSVVVLDEPTEYLEPEIADALTEDIFRITRQHSVIVFTHRLTGLENVDEILVLREGVVVERGSHQALLGLGGWYATAWTREQELAEVADFIP